MEKRKKVKFIGKLSLLPLELKQQCEKLEQETKHNNEFKINFAIAYGGRQELIEAVKKILKNKTSPEQVNEELIE